MMEKQSKYCKYVIVCRGVCPWMKDEVNDPTPGLAEEAQAEGRLYPSLRGLPSAPPPPYICPVLTLEGGTLWGQEGRTGTVKGGVVDFQEDPAPSTPVWVNEGVNTGVVQPRLDSRYTERDSDRASCWNIRWGHNHKYTRCVLAPSLSL